MSASDRSERGEKAPPQRAEWIDHGASSAPFRVGNARLVKGGATVSTVMEEAPAEAMPAGQGRSLGEAEIAESGLFQDRVIEIGEMREEVVVRKVASVREELVVRRTAEEHVETISDKVRHTEVDVEEGAADRSAFGSFGTGEDRTSSEADRADFERDRSR